MLVWCRSCRDWSPCITLNNDPFEGECSACGTLFDEWAQLSEEPTSRPGSPSSVRKRRAEPLWPPGWRVRQPQNVDDMGMWPLRIEPAHRAWVSWLMAVAMLALLAAAIGLLVLTATHTQSLALLLFSLPAVALLLVVTYLGLVARSNHTVLTVTQALLIVDSKPFPWRRRAITRRMIRELFAVRTGREPGGTEPSGFELRAELFSGERLTLVSGLPSAGHALYLQQRVGEQLGLWRVV